MGELSDLEAYVNNYFASQGYLGFEDFIDFKSFPHSDKSKRDTLRVLRILYKILNEQEQSTKRKEERILHESNSSASNNSKSVKALSEEVDKLQHQVRNLQSQLRQSKSEAMTSKQYSDELKKVHDRFQSQMENNRSRWATEIRAKDKELVSLKDRIRRDQARSSKRNVLVSCPPMKTTVTDPEILKCYSDLLSTYSNLKSDNSLLLSTLYDSLIRIKCTTGEIVPESTAEYQEIVSYFNSRNMDAHTLCDLFSTSLSSIIQMANSYEPVMPQDDQTFIDLTEPAKPINATPSPIKHSNGEGRSGGFILTPDLDRTFHDFTTAFDSPSDVSISQSASDRFQTPVRPLSNSRLSEGLQPLSNPPSASASIFTSDSPGFTASSSSTFESSVFVLPETVETRRKSSRGVTMNPSESVQRLRSLAASSQYYADRRKSFLF
ncbi:hypothetical protein CANCADRAFT_44855 [Tortispora caseinolytica NRRL Y-17796]|uniref:Uncharacterized protein n=1 Tax=Tortispora caseinolytica NRRL Y-17796 TaxID=767744 RepID=A0A1E4THL7_9ASCO|nr:hypothetical protein CANCADRAFT_44855 [Tortispora caseinolytica NRRL Y-17796]